VVQTDKGPNGFPLKAARAFYPTAPVQENCIQVLSIELQILEGKVHVSTSATLMDISFKTEFLLLRSGLASFGGTLSRWPPGR